MHLGIYSFSNNKISIKIETITTTKESTTQQCLTMVVTSVIVLLNMSRNRQIII